MINSIVEQLIVKEFIWILVYCLNDEFLSENLRNNFLVDDLFGTIVDQSLITMQMYSSNPNIQQYSSLILYFILDEGECCMILKEN
jgi:hypothetical protein